MSSFISGQYRQANSLPPERQFTLKAGQILHGKVLKQLGHQQVEIQFGGRTLTAVTSGGINEGESRWFQVESTGNPPVIKPVRSDGSGKPDMQQILQNAGLAGNKEVRELLSSMIRLQQPVTSEKLTEAAALLNKSADKAEGLSVIKWMVSRDLPLKDTLFQPILSANRGLAEPMNGLLQQLQSQLKTSGELPLKQMLQTLQDPYSKVTQDLAIQKVFERLTGGTAVEKNEAFNALKQMQILPKEATLSNWSNGLISGHTTKGIEQLIKSLAALPQNQTVQQQISELQIALKGLQPGASQQAAEAVIKGQQLLSSISPQSHLLSLQALQIQQSNTVRPQVFMQALGEVQQLIGQHTNSVSLQLMIKEIVQKMGSDFEARLLNTTNPASAALNIKAQLQALIDTAGTPLQTRDTAEQLINRLNGMQLLSADNGPQQQILMQFPLQLGETNTDVMMKMNGRKKSDGSLDPDHVRVLFYLTLGTLKESIIDMNVQNRIVSLDIYNEHEHLEQIAKPFIPALQTALDQTGYTFSSVKFHSTKDVDPPILNPAEDALSSAYHKVDIKI
ncbi:hypothetical protein JMA_16640 [Jeotgalibacillus malaysiensis]|uniref:Flagellar hook-length control protein-like C-terminal domain-containing protein n=1 Tax=Jeotgalibacillus malaysiensis TaxID=1508404 RepID=A0A0B5ALI3_9BACL|nr:hypothetical protein [Jeotgalibacillus malaysiensis]AJD90981.1 hypothetical protein JMA_16640 [Jeotgalibacillus malaysiensis]